jgi:dimethylamine/trimethylamine dehydrogenase
VVSDKCEPVAVRQIPPDVRQRRVDATPRWHPEKIAPKAADESVLIIGAGPAGLEAARALGQRGYRVTLADRRAEVGGRLVLERRLPGLGEWGRVVDYRSYQVSQMANVEVYPGSDMDAAQVAEFGADHVVLATGATWRLDGTGRENPTGIDLGDVAVMAPEVVMAGEVPEGPVVIFDDDHFYLGGALAEKLRAAGVEVTLVTPAALVSAWTENTMEQHAIQAKLMQMGVGIVASTNIANAKAGEVVLECGFTGVTRSLPCGVLVPVTMRMPEDGLFHDLVAADLPSVTRIGDCLAPSTIAAAVYAGHRYARELGEAKTDALPFRREMVALAERGG